MQVFFYLAAAPHPLCLPDRFRATGPLLMQLRIHNLIRHSKVNGPGERFTLWVQGCSLSCRACFNPETHDPRGGQSMDVEQLAAEIIATTGIEGITISGGEPFQQAEALVHLCRRVRDAGLSVFVFTGYSLDEIRASNDFWRQQLLGLIDILVAGRFDVERRCNLLWRGSDNQKVHFLTDCYHREDYDLDHPLDQAEVTILPSGELQLTGFPDEKLRRALSKLEHKDESQ